SADIWELTNRARAYDNHVYVIGANSTGTDPAGVLYFGNPMIVSPIAEVVARAASHECWVSAVLDPGRAMASLAPGYSVPLVSASLADRNLNPLRRYAEDLCRPAAVPFPHGRPANSLDAMKERSLPLPGGCWKLRSIRLHQVIGRRRWRQRMTAGRSWAWTCTAAGRYWPGWPTTAGGSRRRGSLTARLSCAGRSPGRGSRRGLSWRQPTGGTGRRTPWPRPGRRCTWRTRSG